MLGSDTDVVEPSSDGITNPGQIGANTGRTARKVSMAQAVHFRLACVLLANIFMTACVASPPIEAEPPDINLPPLIDPDRILPSSAIIAVTSSNEIVLEASQLFDPNPEPLLFYAWIADGGWLSQNARVQLSVDQEDLYLLPIRWRAVRVQSLQSQRARQAHRNNLSLRVRSFVSRSDKHFGDAGRRWLFGSVGMGVSDTTGSV